VLNTVLSVAPGTGTISAALAANPGGHLEIRLGCGDYHDNVSILSESFVWIHGGGVQCTAVGPADPTKPTFLIGQKGTAPQYYMRLTDMYITALGVSSTSDGLQFTSDASSVHNDWGVFENLRIEAFQNNISILVGMIWTKFRNIELIDALKNNLNVVPASPTTEPINWVNFANLTSYGAARYGVYANVGSSTTWEFDHVDIEQNANSRAAISNPGCAGFYLSSSGLFSGLSLDNESYFEANCMKSTQADAAQIRITGSQSVYNVNIHDNFFSAASPNGCGVYIDAAASSGTIENNYAGMLASTCGADYSITNNDTGQGNPRLGFSNWTVGPNTYVNNGQGETNFNSSTGRVRYIGINAGGVTNYPQGLTIGGSNSVPVVGSPTVGHAACIKSAGPPIVIGYCSTTPTSGTCTCN
jgi:hypothetical protein